MSSDSLGTTLGASSLAVVILWLALSCFLLAIHARAHNDETAGNANCSSDLRDYVSSARGVYIALLVVDASLSALLLVLVRFEFSGPSHPHGMQGILSILGLIVVLVIAGAQCLAMAIWSTVIARQNADCEGSWYTAASSSTIANWIGFGLLAGFPCVGFVCFHAHRLLGPLMRRGHDDEQLLQPAAAD